MRCVLKWAVSDCEIAKRLHPHEVVCLCRLSKSWQSHVISFQSSLSFAVANLKAILNNENEDEDDEDEWEVIEWARLGFVYFGACVHLKGFTYLTLRWFTKSFERVNGGIDIDEEDNVLLRRKMVLHIQQALLLIKDGIRNATHCIDPFNWASRNGAADLAYCLVKGLSTNALSQGLQLAAICGHEDIVILILDTAKSASLRIPLDESLYQACVHARVSIVKRLLDDLDAQVLPCPLKFNDLLSVSCISGSLEQVDMILKNYSVNKEKRILGAFTAITPTIASGHVEILQRLVDFDASVLNSATLTPAIDQNRVAMVKFLLSQPIAFSVKDTLKAFHQSCEYGFLEIATNLLLPSPSTTKATLPNLLLTQDLTHTFLLACENNHPEIVELLLINAPDAIDPSTNNNQPIRYASTHGYTQIVTLLLDTYPEIIDPSALDNLAIRNACERGHFEIVDRLLQDPAVDPGAFDNASIRLASEYGHAAVVKRLLECPEDLVDPRANECYALRAAARNRHWDVVDLLVRDGRCDLGVRDGYVLKQLQNR
ncbi:UNVERIFIED_CONTAM: hypothetical protein HDU68_001749 [Siphonaria sp. JEL0065]|nr:hypothetical protein HDU68_001749 [Siphonaria sp. JEL0065]